MGRTLELKGKNGSILVLCVDKYEKNLDQCSCKESGTDDVIECKDLFGS